MNDYYVICHPKDDNLFLCCEYTETYTEYVPRYYWKDFNNPFVEKHKDTNVLHYNKKAYIGKDYRWMKVDKNGNKTFV